MCTIIGKIDNFDRKKSYKGFERKSPVTAKVNKCVVSTTVRKKRNNTIPLKEAKAVYKASLMIAK